MLVLLGCISCATPYGVGGDDDDSDVDPGATSGSQATPSPSGTSTPPANNPPATAPGCKTTSARFCLDFESTTPADWTASGTPAAIQSDANAPSPVNALVSHLDAGSAGYSQLGHVVSIPDGVVKVEMDVNVTPSSAIPSNGAVSILEVRSPATTDSNGIQLASYYLRSGGDDVFLNTQSGDDGVSGAFYGPATPLPNGRWAHVVLEIAFAGSGGHVTMTVDGKNVLTKTGIQTSAALGAPSSVIVYFGGYSLIPGTPNGTDLPAVDARYDNIQIY